MNIAYGTSAGGTAVLGATPSFAYGTAVRVGLPALRRHREFCVWHGEFCVWHGFAWWHGLCVGHGLKDPAWGSGTKISEGLEAIENFRVS